MRHLRGMEGVVGIGWRFVRTDAGGLPTFGRVDAPPGIRLAHDGKARLPHDGTGVEKRDLWAPVDVFDDFPSRDAEVAWLQPSAVGRVVRVRPPPVPRIGTAPDAAVTSPCARAGRAVGSHHAVLGSCATARVRRASPMIAGCVVPVPGCRADDHRG